MNYQNSVGINTVAQQLETSVRAASNCPVAIEKYADRYLGRFSYRFNGGSIWRHDERWFSCHLQLSSTGRNDS